MLSEKWTAYNLTTAISLDDWDLGQETAATYQNYAWIFNMYLGRRFHYVGVVNVTKSNVHGHILGEGLCPTVK